MKKIFLLVFSIFLFSCSSDDDDTSINAAEIAGNWEYSKTGTVLNGKEILTNYQHSNGCQKDYYELKEDGVSVVHVFSESCKDVSDVVGNATGTWKLDGKILTINDLGEENKYDVLILNTTKLKIRQNAGDQLIYEFIKR